jgi:adenylate cyclase
LERQSGCAIGERRTHQRGECIGNIVDVALGQVVEGAHLDGQPGDLNGLNRREHVRTRIAIDERLDHEGKFQPRGIHGAKGTWSRQTVAMANPIASGPTSTDRIPGAAALRFLHDWGVSEAEIDTAALSNTLPLLVVETLFQPGPNQYTAEQMAEKLNLPVDYVLRVRRALGFTDPEPGDMVGGDADVQAIRNLMEGVGDFRLALDRVRTAAGPMSRTADAIALAFSVGIGTQLEQGYDQFGVADEVIADGDPAYILDMLVHVLRRELTGAVRRIRLDHATTQTQLTVDTGIGFVDLVGYTELMLELDEAQTVELVRRIESVGHDEVARLGGSVVKMVGDGLLFRAPTPEQTVEIAMELVRQAGTGMVPPARAGVTWGPVVRLHGDLFGPTVNLASRLMAEAETGTVFTGGAMADLVPVVPAGERALKGIGTIATYRVVEKP